MCVSLFQMDRRDELRRVEIEALELARRRGNRQFLIAFAGMISTSLMEDGDWDGAMKAAEEWVPREPTYESGQGLNVLWLAWMALERDDPEGARRLISLAAPDIDETTTDQQLLGVVHFRLMLIAIDESRPDDLIAATADLVKHYLGRYPTSSASHLGIALDVLEPAGDVSVLLPLADLIDAAPASQRSRLLEIGVARTRGVAASLAGDHDGAVDWFVKALAAARNLGEQLYIAQVLAGYARALVRAGRADEAEPLATEAREAFERMGAVRAIARLDAAMPAGITA
jgi:tetratricopeptide (TPR) repeat protein